MKPTLKLWLAAVAAVLAASWNSDGAVREVPPYSVSTYLDGFPQTLRLNSTLLDGENPSYSWENAEYKVNPSWSLVATQRVLKNPLIELDQAGYYRLTARAGDQSDSSTTVLSLDGPRARVDPLALYPLIFLPIRAVLPMPDGSLVRAGYSFGDANSEPFGLGRHGPDWRADPKWAGLTNTAALGLPVAPVFLALAAQLDGGVLAGTEDGRLLRVTAEGKWDVEFSNRHVFSGALLRIRLDPVGNILVAGTFGLRRLFADGRLDAAFHPARRNSGTEVSDFVIQRDLKLVVASRTPRVDGGFDMKIRRFLPNGRPDRRFRNLSVQGINNVVHSMALLPDDSILIGGKFDALAGVPARNLARVSANGTPDGIHASQLPSDPLKHNVVEVGQVVVLARNAGVVVVARSVVRGQSRNMLYQFDASGSRVRLESPELEPGSIETAAEDGAGRIVVGGSFNPVFFWNYPRSWPQYNCVAISLPAPSTADVRPRIEPSSGLWLRSTAFRNPEEGFAVGDGGRAYQTLDSGRSWERIKTGLTNDLFAVALDGPLVYAAGSAGLFARWVQGATNWDRLPTGTEANLRGIWMSWDGSPSVLGDQGTLLRSVGGKLTRVETGTTSDLNWVSSIADEYGTAFIGGQLGTLLKLTWSGVERIESGTTRNLLAVGWTSRNRERWIAVDEYGAVHADNSVLSSLSSNRVYTSLLSTYSATWAGGADGVVEKDFAIERRLPTDAPIRSLVPIGQHVYAFSADGGMFIIKDAQTDGLQRTNVTVVSPTNGQAVLKQRYLSVVTRGAGVTTAWIEKVRADGSTEVQRGYNWNLGLGIFGRARLFVATGAEGKNMKLVGPIEIEVTGPPDITGLETLQRYWYPITPSWNVGSNLAISASVRGIEPLSFQWFRNGQALPGQTNAELRVNDLKTSDSGRYRLFAHSPAGSSEDRIFVEIRERSGPVSFFRQPKEQILYAGQRELAGFETPFSGGAGFLPVSVVSEANGQRLNRPGSWANSNLFELQPTNRNQSGLQRLYVTNTLSPLSVSTSQPFPVLVREVTNRLVFLQRDTESHPGKFTIGFFGLGDEAEIDCSFLFQDGFVANGDIRNMRFLGNRLFSIRATNTFSTVTNGFFKLQDIFPSPSNRLANPILIGLTNFPAALGVRSSGGKPLPARFVVLPEVSIGQTPAFRPLSSSLPGNVQQVTIGNGSFGRADRVRLRFSALGVDGTGAPIGVAEATGEDGFGRYLDIGPIESGAVTNVLVRYTVPDGLSLPDPVLRFDWPESQLAAFPSSTFLSLTPESNPTGQAVLRFNTVRGWRYLVESSSQPAGPWADFSGWIPGNDATVELPATPSSAQLMRYWRVKIEAGEN